MDYAIQRCCITSVFLKQYETSTDAVLNRLGIELRGIKEFNCCGFPLKNSDFKGYVLSSARNIALAEKQGLNIITLCNCCYGSLRHVDHQIKKDPVLKDDINEILKKEGLEFTGRAEINHVLEVLNRDVGIEAIGAKITRQLKDLKIAVHYGCHILRPRELVQLNSPGSSSVFDELVALTGAELVSWDQQEECCGSSIYGINDDLSMDLTRKKIETARKAHADILCTACCYCQTQFDRVQKRLGKQRNMENLPSIIITQLLGLCLGIDQQTLGIQDNELSLDKLMDKLS
jgi:heterodisulfide reductase subunit B